MLALRGVCRHHASARRGGSGGCLRAGGAACRPRGLNVWALWVKGNLLLAPRGCLDYALVAGGERRQWSVAETYEVHAGGARGKLGGPLSDHKLVRFECRFEVPKGGDRRYVEKTRFDSWGAVEQEALERAMLLHAPVVSAVEDSGEKYLLLQELLLQEVRVVEAARKVIEAAVAERARRRPLRMLRNGWLRKLGDALRLSKQAGAAGFDSDRHPLFCEKGGLRYTLRKALVSAGGAEAARAAVLRKCRAELAYWGRQLAFRERTQRRRLLDELERAAKAPAGECVRLLHAAFDSLKERSAAIGPDSVLTGDVEDGEEIAGPGDAFTQELGRIGTITQEAYQGDGVLVEGFAAWCNAFLPRWETLRMADGAEWKLEDAMTYELFESALARIAKRKAAGANRVTLDALVQAPEWVRRCVHAGLAEFASSGVFPAKWDLVVYVLLAKPRGDQRLVGKRQDIALLAQDLKLLCRMIKMESYDRV